MTKVLLFYKNVIDIYDIDEGHEGSEDEFKDDEDIIELYMKKEE